MKTFSVTTPYIILKDNKSAFPAVSMEGYTDYYLVAYHSYEDKACDWLKIIITWQS